MDDLVNNSELLDAFSGRLESFLVVKGEITIFALPLPHTDFFPIPPRSEKSLLHHLSVNDHCRRRPFDLMNAISKRLLSVDQKLLEHILFGRKSHQRVHQINRFTYFGFEVAIPVVHHKVTMMAQIRLPQSLVTIHRFFY